MRRVLRGVLILSAVVPLAAVSCGAEVDLGATRALLPGGSTSDAAIGVGGAGGFGGTEGSGGSIDVDAGPDVLGDSAPQPDGSSPACPQLFPRWEISPVDCQTVLPQLQAPPPWDEILPAILIWGVNVLYRSPLGEEHIIGYVASPEACDGVVDGWYVIDPWNPRLIVLCPETCNAIETKGGELFMGFGCDRVRAEPR
jgi:hypothetical protein